MPSRRKTKVVSIEVSSRTCLLSVSAIATNTLAEIRIGRDRFTRTMPARKEPLVETRMAPTTTETMPTHCQEPTVYPRNTSASIATKTG